MSIRQRLWKLTMRLRFKRAPEHPRAANGRYISRRDWRLEQMGAGR